MSGWWVSRCQAIHSGSIAGLLHFSCRISKAAVDTAQGCPPAAPPCEPGGPPSVSERQSLRVRSMAKLIYAAITSLDGYIEDANGRFDWCMPDEEVHAFVNDLERPIGTY